MNEKEKEALSDVFLGSGKRRRYDYRVPKKGFPRFRDWLSEMFRISPLVAVRRNIPAVNLVTWINPFVEGGTSAARAIKVQLREMGRRLLRLLPQSLRVRLPYPPASAVRSAPVSSVTAARWRTPAFIEPSVDVGSAPTFVYSVVSKAKKLH